MKIGFIGFGEAARAFQQSLAAADPGLEFSAYDILLEREGADGTCAEAMRARKVALAFPPRNALRRADWIVSAVTADQSLAAAKAAVAWLRPEQVYFDINSVSPDRKRQCVEVLAPTGARYVDMAVMAAVHPNGHRTPTLLAGPVTQALSQTLANLGFAFEVVGEAPGETTAIKMVRSLFVKGLEAVTVETLLAASASGCLDRVLTSLGRTYPGLGLPDFARYQLDRTLKHGARRAAEMRESAATIEALHLHGRLAEAIADVQDLMGALPRDGLSGGALADDLAELAAMRRSRTA